jgi:hypothetical protein
LSTKLDPSIEAARLRSFASMGAPGSAIVGGYIVENERDPRLTGTKKYETYGNILANTSIVAAGVRYFLNLIGKARWTVLPAEDGGPRAEEIAKRVGQLLYQMRTPWHRVVRRAAMFKFYGFSTQEWIAERKRDGVIGFKDIKARPQKTIERWDVADDGEVLGVEQVSPQDGMPMYIPRSKLIYMVDDSINDSPQGLGLFRHLASRAVTLERYELLEAWGFERDLRGTPIGRGPLSELEAMVTNGSLTRTQADALRAPVEEFVQNALKGVDTGMVLDSNVYRGTGDSQTPSTIPQWNIELLRGTTTSQPDMASAIERLNREMARMLGVEHLLLGSDSSGSFALSKDKTQSFGMIVTSTLQEIGETMEEDLLTPLMELNGWPEEDRPTMRPEQIQFRDVEQVTKALADIAKAGAPLAPDDEAIDEVRDMMGLSKHTVFVPPVPVPGQGPEQGAGQPDEPTDQEDPEDSEEPTEPVEKIKPKRKRKAPTKRKPKATGYQHKED